MVTAIGTLLVLWIIFPKTITLLLVLALLAATSLVS